MDVVLEQMSSYVTETWQLSSKGRESACPSCPHYRHKLTLEIEVK